MLQDLKELGFTPNEIKVYESLLKIGETSVGGIINNLKIHRQIAYNALDALEKRGMVSKTMKNKVYHFKITDPEIIIENIQRQELIAKRLSHLIKEEIKKDKHEKEINIYNSKDGLRRCFLSMYQNTEKNGTVHILRGMGFKYDETLGDDFVYNKIEKIRKTKNIHSKNILSKSLKNDNDEFMKKIDSKLRQYKFLDYDISNPVSTLIFEGHVSFVSFGKDLFAIEIKNDDFYNSYLEHFEILWKIAKK